MQGDVLSLGTWLWVNYTKTCHANPHQVRVEAAQSNIPLYRLAEKYDLTWHTNSKELAVLCWGTVFCPPAQTLIANRDIPTLETEARCLQFKFSFLKQPLRNFLV